MCLKPQTLHLKYFIFFTGVRTISSHVCGNKKCYFSDISSLVFSDKSRYSELKYDLFPTLTNCFLCLKLTKP